VATPKSMPIGSVSEVPKAVEKLGFPMIIKVCHLSGPCLLEFGSRNPPALARSVIRHQRVNAS
jgi:hypothetical protein